MEISHGMLPLSIRYSEEILNVGPSLDGVDASTYFVDTCCKELVHPSSSYAFEGEHRVKGFFLLVPKEEQEAPRFVLVDLIAPFHSQQQLRNPIPILNASMYSGALDFHLTSLSG